MMTAPQKGSSPLLLLVVALVLLLGLLVQETASWTTTAAAFGARRPHHRHCDVASRLRSSPIATESDTAAAGVREADTEDGKMAKDELLSTARRLKDEYGLFLVDRTAKQDLKLAVERLERVAPSSATSTTTEDRMWGDWELVCTTASSVEGIDTKSLFPFFETEGPLKQIRNAIRKSTNDYLTVTQRIRSDTENDTAERSTTPTTAKMINRIDHVLEYRPPDVLRDVLDNLPEQLSLVNINPLQVSKSKLILIHKASIVDNNNEDANDHAAALLKIQLSLKAIVLNVAGRSTLLDPAGQDVSALNLPLGEFLNAGSFTTTFVDEDLRISRGRQGLVEQLRVFLRSSPAATTMNSGRSRPDGGGVTTELDVDESMDPEFGNIQSPSDVED